MLSADYLAIIPEEILALFQEYEQSVINDIARRLAGMDFASPTAAWQMQRLTESGLVYDAALADLSKLTGRSERALQKIFREAGVRALAFDDAIYKAAGLDPLPLNLSPAMTQVLVAGLQRTQGTMRNLTLTSAIDAQNLFTDAADLAYMQVSSGAFDYNSAIRQAVESVAEQGVSVIHYASGRREHLDVAMRRAVLTGVNQTSGQLQIARADEMGCDLIQTSAHIGARNTGTGPANHEGWQGRIFSRSGQHSKYLDFVTETGFGTGEGLCGWNCRHSFYPFYEGISKNAYTKAQVNEYARKTVNYNGQDISVYEATQKQRAIEREIRKAKRQAEALKTAGLDNTEVLERVKELQGKMRDFIRQTGLRRQYKRESMGSSHLKNLPPRVTLKDIQGLQPDDVLILGEVKKAIVSEWTTQTDGNLSFVLTGKQRLHYVERHPEVVEFEGFLVDAILFPDEVHRNQADEMMAIFYKMTDDKHGLRIAVLMQEKPGEYKHSVISYRLCGINEILRGRKKGKCVWTK